ncbi:MAG: hypothetical protein JJE22_11020 [Bacteroidia bacterium]|nr:hypothetical protein [Bacteroidia bacterium]
MKKYFLISTLLLFAFIVKAQNYDAAKTLLTLGQYKQAKESVDKGMSNSKFASKPEAYILKASIYAGLSQDTSLSVADGDQLREEAIAAFNKYEEMDPALSLLKDPIYQNGPVNIYSSLYSAGYKTYDKKEWDKSYESYKKAVELADMLIREKIFSVPIDTNSIILAGLSAENSGRKDEAAKYYARLADIKLGGEGFESIYRFLVSYYFSKKDIPSFEKYKDLGGEVYPKSEYFKYDKVDFAVGLEDNFDKKVKALEQVLAADPNNFKAQESLGEIIYDTLNPRDDDAIMPSNADELEKKMLTSFTKAAQVNPESELPLLHLGDHFINKSVTINDSFKVHTSEMRKRTKPGAQPSKEDAQKRDDLDKQYGNALEAARDPYEKSAAIFGKRDTLTLQDKQQYKKVTSYLSDIYNYKKNKAIAKSPEALKYAAEEKKWNDMYDSIK